MTNEQLTKVRNALGVFEPFERKHTNLIEALDILDRELAKPEQEPVAWMADDGRLCKETTKQYLRLSMAQDFHIPLYRHPALKGESK